MSKKVLQDINTRNTNIKEEGFKRKWNYGNSDSAIVEREQSSSIDKASGIMYDTNKSKRDKVLGFSKKIWLGIIVGIAIILLLVFWSMFATATVKVVLSQQTTTINDTFSANRGIDSEKGLSYQIVKLQKKATRDVQPTSEEKVERKASGQIVVYNKYSTKDQKLIVNTRFEAPNGKIYRIDKPIIIPGGKGSGENMVPGSIEVTVYADEAGEEYNIDSVDFTVPGLNKGTSLYEGIFARSKTEIKGGYSGMLKSASEEDIEKTTQDLRRELNTLLQEEISSTIGDDSIFYEDAVFVNFTTNVPTEISANGMLTVEETGLLQIVVFNKKELSSEIAEKSLSSYDDSVVLVRNLDEMHFILENKEEFDLTVDESFDFVLSGSPHIVWEIDEKSFKDDLAGLSKNSISTIIQNHSSVRKIEAEIKPFWKSSFPDNPDSIILEEVLE